eukprot:scaffold213225_cov26-Tisochrysis_lutea.AAC.1
MVVSPRSRQTAPPDIAASRTRLVPTRTCGWSLTLVARDVAMILRRDPEPSGAPSVGCRAQRTDCVALKIQTRHRKTWSYTCSQ